MCALNLGDRPGDVDKRVFILDFKLQTPSDVGMETVPYPQRYRATFGVNSEMDYAKALLGPQAKVLFDNLATHHKFLVEKRNSLGMIAAILRYSDTMDFTLVRVPPLNMLRSRIYMWDWRSNPV